METKIPPTEKRQAFSAKKFLTREPNLAATCLADDRVPRLTIQDISVIVEDEKRYASFCFPDNPDVARIFRAWVNAATGKDNAGTDVVAKTYRAFHYWYLFVNIITAKDCARHNGVIPEGFTWTNNTKIPATALALIPGQMFTEDRLRRMVYQHGSEFGFVMREDDTVKAYEDPEGYIADHPDEHRSYVIAALYQRDHLKELIRTLPARHRFEDSEGGIHLVPEPKEQPTEIPRS